MRTMGSVSLCRSLLAAGVVDRQLLEYVPTVLAGPPDAT
jgi:hypothetical protein